MPWAEALDVGGSRNVPLNPQPDNPAATKDRMNMYLMLIPIIPNPLFVGKFSGTAQKVMKMSNYGD